MHKTSHIFFFALAILIVIAARLLGPSDIHDKEQPRTTSYTADMLINGNWILPHDATGLGATKPPLYNWISIPFVAAFGFNEWTLRSAAMLATIAAFFLIAWFARWLAHRAMPGQSQQARAAGRIAAVIWLVSFNTMRLMTLARPDMVLVACLTAAWALATMAIVEEQPRRRLVLCIALWIATALAALDKGPMALIPMFYILFAGKMLAGKWGAANRTQWWWGIPFVLIIFGSWAYTAYLSDPHHFKEVLLGKEVGDRVVGSITLLTGWWRVPHYSIFPFLPWTLFALAALVLIPARQWFKHPLAPALLWILILAAGFSCLVNKRADRFAPMFPAAAALAGFVIVQLAIRFQRTAWIPALVLLIAVTLAVYRLHFSDEAANHYGDNVKSFATAVHEKTGTDSIAFTGTDMTPLATLLARYQAGNATPEILANARWQIRPIIEGDQPTLTSDLIDQVATPKGSAPARLGLFPLTRSPSDK